MHFCYQFVLAYLSLVPRSVPKPNLIVILNPQGYLLSLGQQINVQTWGRDSLATGSFLSDALEYFVGP